MIPLVAVIMTGAMGSGIAISKTGKYKIYPLVGIVFIVVALVSMSFVLEADTSVWTLVPFMVLMGLGLGFNFQPVILAVQNAVSPREMGVATSSVTFFRQMGGTIGVAAFLSILFTRLPTDIGNAIASAAAADPQGAGAQAAQLQQQGLEGLTADTTAIAKFPALVAPFREGFTASIDLVFLVAAAVVAIGFFVLIFLPQVALSEKSGIQAQQDADGPGTAVTPEVGADQPIQAVGASAATSTAPPSGTPEDPRH
jgi:hypothetical protein